MTIPIHFQHDPIRSFTDPHSIQHGILGLGVIFMIYLIFGKQMELTRQHRDKNVLD